MDPYEPPTSSANELTVNSCRQVVIWWEKKRLIYNGVMLVFGLLMLLPALNQMNSALIALMLAYGLGANLCFFLGPLIETYYIALSGKRSLIFGLALFWLGFFFSIGLTFLIGILLWGSSLPNQL